ncbi:MAG TPA: acetyl-CoA carboxylase biotin carboxyl carrier protein [Candidatus Acidoferrum sp.]|jgi:acetyl-CoA carboxylase biotin carboxyl carrier protein|nr:acetyl-CoA carboxylase biotin carboxyl carrier protein [Candidatus Acidoferrum sp.]
MKRKPSSKSNTGSTIGASELEQIEQLLSYMSEHNLEEFEFENGSVRIRLKKPSAAPIYAAPPPRALAAAEIIVAGAASQPAGGGTPSSASAGHATAASSEDLHLVKSPIVGTYYGAPSPGAEPFVKVGGFVESGQTLCIVEAMKLMNEIESDMSGEVVRVFAENGQPVEYGQPLFGIRPSRKK